MPGSGSGYQVIAEVPVDDFAVLERVAKGLSRTFKLDLSARRGQLRKGGVCVCQPASFEDAKAQAEMVRGIGADYRILDGQGRLVARGEGRRAGASPAGPPVDATLQGGYTAPREQRPTDPALARTLAGPGPVSPPVAAAAAPAQASRPGFRLDALETDDLVMLDGSKEVEQASAVAPLGVEQAISPSVFAPPAEDDALELDEPSPRPWPAQPHVPTLPSATAPAEVSPAPEPEEEVTPLEDLMPTTTPAAEPAAPPSHLADAPTPTSMSRPVVAPSRPAPAVTRERFTARGSSSARRDQAERVLFGGWFRQRMRLRIVLGFAIALGLGSVGPIIQSRSIVSARIRPELQELVSARAYPALARLANYRNPDEIEDSISGIKTRYSVISFIMWLATSGLLAFLWFRFV